VTRVVETVDSETDVSVWTVVTIEVVVRFLVEVMVSQLVVVKILVSLSVLMTVAVETARAYGQNARLTSSQVLLEGVKGPLGE